MKFKKQRNYSNDNSDFNASVFGCVNELLFPPDDIDHYVPKCEKSQDTIDFDEESVSNTSKRIKEEDSYEELLKKALTEFDGEKLILAGEMGVGKTSLVKYVIKQLEKNGFTSDSARLNNSPGLVYYKNVNTALGPNQYQELLDDLEGVIDVIFHSVFDDETLARAFLQYIKQNRSDLKWPFRFRTLGGSSEGNPSDALFEFVENQTKSRRVQLIKDCLFYYVTEYHKQNKKIILVFDNLDILPPIVQHEYMSYLLRFAQGSALKILMCVRPITFGKVSRSSIIYSYIYYSGHDPARILLNRLETFQERIAKDRSAVLKGAKPQFADYLFLRIEQVRTMLSNPKGRLYKLINAICGHSKRKALLMAQRFFSNDQISFLEPQVKEDQIIQVFVTDRSIYITPQNEEVTNLFSNHISNNSFIKVRILQLLMHNLTHRKGATRVSEVLSFLRCFECYEDQEIFAVFDEMIDEKKGLIYVPAVNEYATEEEFARSSNDYVFVRQSGARFLASAMLELQYVQNCFYSIDWSIKKINEQKTNLEDFLSLMAEEATSDEVRELCEINLNILMGANRVQLSDYLTQVTEIDIVSYAQRFRFLRECLQILLLEDVCDILKYIDNEAHSSYRLKELASERMIESIYSSVKNITTATNLPEMEGELQQWESLKIMASNWNKIVSDQLN